MKKIYLKSLLVTTLCLVSLSANAQVIRNVVKGSVDVKRQVDGKRGKLISDDVVQTTPPITPHVREIKVLPKPIIFKKNLLSIPAIGADSTIFKRGMSFLEKGDTIGAISCFEVIKEKSPAAEGMLGILHCITSYGNRAIGRVNLLTACVVAAAGTTTPGSAVYRAATAYRLTTAATFLACALPCSRAHVLPHDRSLMKG